VSRLPFLEGLRGLAALYVVLSHFCSMADGRRASGWVSHAPTWLQGVMGAFWYGNLAVAAFIVLSGFCLQLSLFSRGSHGRISNLKVFYRRRARRILPAYYAALALSILVCLTVTMHQTVPPFTRYVPVTTENVLAHVLLVHNFSVDWMYKLNGVLWSIAIEAQLYLVFPLLVLSVVRFGRMRALAGSVALAAATLLLVPVAPKLYPWFLPLFMLGMVSAHLAYRPNLRIGTRPNAARVFGSLALLGTVVACYFGRPVHEQDALIGIAVAALCYVLTTTEEGSICSVLSWRPLVALGTFSYSLYLMHHPIQQVVFVNRPAFVSGELASLLYLVIVGLPIILLGTWLFHMAFERPFMPRRAVTKLDLLPTLVPVQLPLRTYARSQAPADAKPDTSPARSPRPEPVVALTVERSSG